MHIDWWTLALQAVNVLVLVWILAHFFYGPVAGMIEQRRLAAAKVLADASAARSAAEAEMAGIRATRDGFAAEHDKLLAEARSGIEAQRDGMLRDATERIETLRKQNEAILARERTAMEHGLAGQASALAVQIAQKLLERLPPDAAMAMFLDALSAQIRALPQKSRELFAASAQGGVLDITTASVLNEAQQRQCRDAIASVLGCETQITFRADPRLITGLEVNAGPLILRNNWQSDLQQIVGQLKNDE